MPSFCAPAAHSASSSIHFSLKSRRQIERYDRDSRLSSFLKWEIRCLLMWVRLRSIGYRWNGGSKCGSSEEELCHCYDIVHWIGIIQMQVWLDNSQPMMNMILERCREVCKEHDIVLYFGKLSINDQDDSDLGILSQVVLTMHCFCMIVPYKILDISTTVPVGIPMSMV